MILKIFRHGSKSLGSGSSKGVDEYVLDDERVNDGTAKLIRGDRLATLATIDSSPYDTTYTAGCLSFSKDELLTDKRLKELRQSITNDTMHTEHHRRADYVAETSFLTDEQKQALMQSFEQALLPDFDPTRYACYWVEHTDKDRLELNFVFAKIDLATGKHLDVYQHRRDVARMNYWKEIQIQEYGFSDPNAPQHERTFCPNPIKRADGTKPNDKYKEIKEALNEYVLHGINQGQIHNAQDVQRFIEFEMGDETKPTGYQVKQNKTGMSVTDTTTNAKFRLQGATYSRDFCLSLDRQHRQTQYNQAKDERLAIAKERFENLSLKRKDQLETKYSIPLMEQSNDRPTPKKSRPLLLFGKFRKGFEQFNDQFEKPIINSDKFIEGTEQIIDFTEQNIDGTKQCLDDTKSVIGSTATFIERTEQNIDGTKQCLDDTKSVIGSTATFIERIAEPIDTPSPQPQPTPPKGRTKPTFNRFLATKPSPPTYAEKLKETTKSIKDASSSMVSVMTTLQDRAEKELMALMDAEFESMQNLLNLIVKMNKEKIEQTGGTANQARQFLLSNDPYLQNMLSATGTDLPTDLKNLQQKLKTNHEPLPKNINKWYGISDSLNLTRQAEQQFLSTVANDFADTQTGQAVIATVNAVNTPKPSPQMPNTSNSSSPSFGR